MKFLVALLLLASSPALAQVRPACTDFGAENWLSVELLYGRNRHDGTSIDGADWSAYLAESVTPRFPDGLTVLEGAGQWFSKRRNAVISEPSTVVLIATPNTPDLRTRIDAVRDDYKKRFSQDSVGLIITESCVAF